MKFLYVLFLAFILLGCNKSEKTQPDSTTTSTPPPSNTPAPVAIDKSTAGAIVGTVLFTGPVTKFPTIDMTQDPACPTSPQTPDVVLVNHGKLANAFVYVKDGLGQAAFSPPSEPAALDQKGCRYLPHVLGLMVGQPLQILNHDDALHNIHPMPRNNPDWNETQMPRGAPITKTFQHQEIMVPVQCNQHPWMKAYLSMLPHPYFAVSAPDGSFQIKDLPPGEYTLAAVHEKFGEQTMKIKVGRKETAKASFTFNAR